MFVRPFGDAPRLTDLFRLNQLPEVRLWDIALGVG